MEPRLLPVNAVLALTTPGDMNPCPLADAGFRIAALEVPVGVEPEKLVVDVVLWHPEEAVLVAVEGKSGANVDEPQAQKYGRLDAQSLVHASSVDLRSGGRPSTAILYAVQEHNVARIRQGLAAAGVSAPILGVTTDHVQLHEAQVAHPLIASALGTAVVELPWKVPRILPCDHDSPLDIVRPQVMAVVIGHLPDVPTRSAPRPSLRRLCAIYPSTDEARRTVSFTLSAIVSAESRQISQIRSSSGRRPQTTKPRCASSERRKTTTTVVEPRHIRRWAAKVVPGAGGRYRTLISSIC
ncbi:MAG TPA: hypothetical protein VHB69_09210 [Mycobacteriales bacterium]|nr:hypothetical protein [Mycobacteriales bacterium]